MTKALGNEIIFHDDDDPYLAIDYATTYENEIHHSILPISFCPFCGKKIKFIEGSPGLT